jgi:Spy/CpxP family protein refolding chaperone
MTRYVGILVLVLLILALTVASVYAAQGTKPGGTSIGVGMQGLSKHPLTPAQKNQIAAIRQENRQKVQSIMSNSKLTQKQKDDQIAAVRMDTHKKMMAVLTPDQRKELADFKRAHAKPAAQGKGPAVKTSKATAASEFPMLKKHPLTNDQKQRIADMRRDEKKEIQAVNADKKLTSTQKADRIKEIRSRTRSDILSVLTTEQKDELKGAAKARRAPVK